MKIIWHGHSCFTVEAEGYSVVFDPYADRSVPGMPILRLPADAVYCSHDHRDHNAVENVRLSGRECPLRVDKLSSFHDEVQGLERGLNIIHILHAENMRVAHLGDLGHIPSYNTMEALRGLDALFIPVGGHYTINAETARKIVEDIDPRVVIPMHFRIGRIDYPELAEVTDYTQRCYIVQSHNNELELTESTPIHTAVMSLGR